MDNITPAVVAPADMQQILKTFDRVAEAMFAALAAEGGGSS